MLILKLIMIRPVVMQAKSGLLAISMNMPVTQKIEAKSLVFKLEVDALALKKHLAINLSALTADLKSKSILMN